MIGTLTIKFISLHLLAMFTAHTQTHIHTCETSKPVPSTYTSGTRLVIIPGSLAFISYVFCGFFWFHHRYTEDIFGVKILTIALDAFTIVTHCSPMVNCFSVYVLVFSTFDPNAWRLAPVMLTSTRA